MAVRSGQNQRRVAIQRATFEAGRANYQNPTWNLVAFDYANIKPLTFRERTEGMQVRPDVTHKVKLRFREDLQERDRLLFDSGALDIEVAITMPDDQKRTVFGSRVLSIEGIGDIDERRREMELICRDGKYHG